MSKAIECIILIDDNPHDNFFHKIVIEDSGCCQRVIVFESALDALTFFTNEYEAERANSSLPWVVFLDINMPLMNGFEFLEEYKKLSVASQADLLIMMLTTSSLSDEKDKAHGLGVNKLYNKPLEQKHLDEILRIISVEKG